ncbi:hypothetical protein ACIQPR_18135 [Streptomyces sp. NPDC091280]|uniref:hypothetical protein n=1 Tax=Streptomyces sp. NPDC091280 TaxID=3365984 RepID=UPI00381D4D09
MPTTLEFAETGYTAYGQSTGLLTHDGAPMPGWDELSDRTRAAWVQAAGAVALAAIAGLTGADVGGSGPDVGDVVLVPVVPDENNGASVAPAIVTRVWSKSVVNVRVLGDGNTITWRTSLSYVESLDGALPGAAVWTWTGGER